MDSSEHSKRPDDGTSKTVDQPDTDDETSTDECILSVKLPESSLFDLDDYLRMYQVASKPKQFRILNALAQRSELSTSELSEILGEQDNALHYPLRTLKDATLIRNRRDPNTGTKETYSYYELTEMGRIVLTEGVREGMGILVRQEIALEEKYGG